MYSTSGVRVECDCISARLEPETNNYVGPLKIIPLEEGTLKLLYLSCTIYGITYRYSIMSDSLTVLKPQPKIVLRETSQILKSVFVYEGEM